MTGVQTCALPILIKWDPRSANAHFIRAIALEGRGAGEEAMASTRKGLELMPTAVVGQTMMARLYLSRGDAKGAIEFLGPLLKNEPRSALLHFLLGQAQLAAGNLPMAGEEFMTLAAAFPQSGELKLWLGRYYGAKGDAWQARVAFTRALELDPGSLPALNGLVSLELVAKKADAVRALLEPRLEAAPKNEALLFLAGSSYLTLGDVQRAEPLLRRVLELNPSNIDAYARLGTLYVSQKRLDEARAEFENIARQQERPVAARIFVGIILDMQNRPDEARKQYEEALAMNPRAAVAANNLAMHHVRAGNLDGALQLAQAAKAELPDDARVSDTLGWIYYQKGMATLAITALRQSVEQNPKSAESRYHLGLALLKNGDKREARQSLEQALKLNGSFPDAAEARQALTKLKG